MGGRGSGLWERQNAKLATDNCLALDVNYFARKRILVVGFDGEINWTNPQSGKEIATISFSILRGRGAKRIIRLSYRFSGSDLISSEITLESTVPFFGGLRWWFRCPLHQHGIPCNQRIGKLYMRGAFFGCRNCLDLTYRSSQESHQLERLLNRYPATQFPTWMHRRIKTRLLRSLPSDQIPN